LETTDRELISKTLNGELKSYDQLMQRYEKLVYKVAYSFGSNQQNTMDITQNTFLRAYENLASYQDKGSFQAWIVKITYNEGINWTKKNKKYEQFQMIDNDQPRHISDISQEDELLAKENKAQLLKSLFTLSTKYRLAVVLRYFNDMPLKEIAKVLNCSEGVVKNILFRSLQRLRQNLISSNMGEINAEL
jgi:RNA polymerase sigma-70 factor (ECF subfamily)